jgi:hypothetical protein
MIECVFTLDYEIYGNGEGSLNDLMYEPTKKLMQIFEEAGLRFVCFVEAVELEKIEEFRPDASIYNIRNQIWELHNRGFEIALHLHPQWSRAKRKNERWLVDYSEYNLCVLPRERVVQVVAGAIDYLRKTLELPTFTPLAYRAGNWLFQPTRTVASVLIEHGIKIDSSVFKGGVQHGHKLDYRLAGKNGPFWTFRDDVNVAEPAGALLEIPIYTEMVPSWKLITQKRLGLQKNSFGAGKGVRQKFSRIRDLIRLQQPLKFDFCRMTRSELISMMDRAIVEDRQRPELFRPMVAIGHSKDLVDFESVKSFLFYLVDKGIAVSTFEGVYGRCCAYSVPDTRCSRDSLSRHCNEESIL